MSIVAALGAQYLMSRAIANHNNKVNHNEWQFRQSNARQLEVEDLRKAGLNPILAATNGQMAAAPQTSDIQTPDVISAVSNARDYKLHKKELNVASFNAQTERINAITEKQKADELERNNKAIEKQQADEFFQHQMEFNKDYRLRMEQFEHEKKKDEQIIADMIRNTDITEMSEQSKMALNAQQIKLIKTQIAMNDENIKLLKNDVKFSDNAVADDLAERNTLLYKQLQKLKNNPNYVMNRYNYEVDVSHITGFKGLAPALDIADSFGFGLRIGKRFGVRTM